MTIIPANLTNTMGICISKPRSTSHSSPRRASKRCRPAELGRPNLPTISESLSAGDLAQETLHIEHMQPREWGNTVSQRSDSQESFPIRRSSESPFETVNAVKNLGWQGYLGTNLAGRESRLGDDTCATPHQASYFADDDEDAIDPFSDFAAQRQGDDASSDEEDDGPRPGACKICNFKKSSRVQLEWRIDSAQARIDALQQAYDLNCLDVAKHDARRDGEIGTLRRLVNTVCQQYDRLEREYKLLSTSADKSSTQVVVPS